MKMFLLGVFLTLLVVNPILTKNIFNNIVDGLHLIYEKTFTDYNSNFKS